MSKKYTILFITVFCIGLLLTGSTYAYWSWTSSVNKNVVFNTAADIEEYIVYNEGYSHFVGDFQPASNYCGGISNTISFHKTTGDAELVDLVASIYMNVNDIGSDILSSNDVYWVITSGNTASCTGNLDNALNYGTFNGKNTGSVINLLQDIEVTTPLQQFTIWIWIDQNGSNLSSLSGETIDTNIWTQFDMLENPNPSTGEVENDDVTGDSNSIIYAVYSADDTSLRFYNTFDTITEGSSYNGLTATAVYTGFEDSVYTSSSSVPWSSYQTNITNVVVEDTISPTSTTYWFYAFRNAQRLDLEKLNTSNVTNMDSMFFETGYVASSFELIGLNNWNVANVTNMNCMFYRAGFASSSFTVGDISGWNTSNVTNMNYMFYQAGNSATYSLDLSTKQVTNSNGTYTAWNVSKVIGYLYFDYGVEDKIIDPTWV